MRYIIGIISALIFAMGFGCSSDAGRDIKGNLIIIGGGKRPTAVMEKFMELAGGKDARIAIIPMASEYYQESGPEYEKEFLALGASETKAFYIHDSLEANSDSLVQALSRYSGIYFGGGDQNRLTRIFLHTRCMDLFHRKYKEGAVLAGTSAGAAIMSQIMITGDGNWTVPDKDSVMTSQGFGFVKSAVIDQHFLKRQRLNRLLTVVVDNQIRGIGIDESTALWVKPGGNVEVLGNSVVIVIDPSRAKYPPKPGSRLIGAQDLRMDILRPGDRFRL
ncbi:MAG: cyanophycinase [Calditrichia bacterium]